MNREPYTLGTEPNDPKVGGGTVADPNLGPKPPADDEPKQPGPDFVENPSDETDDGDWGEDDLEVDDDDDGL